MAPILCRRNEEFFSMDKTGGGHGHHRGAHGRKDCDHFLIKTGVYRSRASGLLGH